MEQAINEAMTLIYKAIQQMKSTEMLNYEAEVVGLLEQAMDKLSHAK